jgi:hypothetical protein
MMLAQRAALAGGLTLMALGVASLGGCPPSLDHPERFQTSCPPNFSVEATLREQCSRVGCHLPGDAGAAGLDLVSAGVFTRLFDVPSPACGGLLVSPLGPDQSLLVQKLEGTSTCGAQMPLGGTPLPASDIACVRAWITEQLVGAVPPDAGFDAGEADAGFDAGDADAGADAGEADAGDAGDAGEADASLDGGG